MKDLMSPTPLQISEGFASSAALVAAETAASLTFFR
jgi:hypothetical protein